MNKPETNAELKPGRQHFLILDGLRGIAALAVVVFHFMEWIFADFSKNFIAHGFLAVDFFFCLSGFVIAYAYDNRIETLGIKTFFKLRFIRLHPLVWLGSVLGLLGFFLDPFANEAAAYSSGMIALVFLSSIFLVPFPVMADRGFNLFSFNAPAWSLFWEYIANILYALILRKLNRTVLLLLTIAAAAGICMILFRTGNLLGGWSKDNFWDGAVRVAYSFLAGMLVYRSNWVIKNKLGFTGLTVLLVLAFLMPFGRWNWLTESFAVIIYFPLIVSLGAGAMLSERVKSICTFSGAISYPLYMTHYAFIWIFGHYFLANKPGTTELTIVVICGTILSVTTGYLVMKFYDTPVRKYLHRRRNK
ncbi:acyltransferase family protein [Lacibacter sediminis]|uniref:Acyltransferase n=1 Tax=Lacibacter sediminis TaxID=2760713 RepID=A0A7G5XFA5_9BACT|nr:acyltransferase [Lacibacter sediminis]QNA44158.1 acyltransferase [Lacibacter sediminis]